jgi:NAD(P)-dependent dehydrogenase (short-subunit alcohol dehydrogenase family)
MELTGKKVVVIGGTSGIGFAVATRTAALGAEAAEAYLYLMRSTYTTGQVLHVDGGMGMT